MKTFRELFEADKVKPSDFKVGETVKFASAFNSRELDLEGKITGFKDHADIKNGYLVIKGTNDKEYKLIYSAVKKLNESVLEEAYPDLGNVYKAAKKAVDTYIDLLEKIVRETKDTEAKNAYKDAEKAATLLSTSFITVKMGIDESVTWNNAEVAAQDAYNDLKNDGWVVKMNSSNAVKLTHDNGCIGTLVFDPKNK